MDFNTNDEEKLATTIQRVSLINAPQQQPSTAATSTPTNTTVNVTPTIAVSANPQSQNASLPQYHIIPTVQGFHQL